MSGEERELFGELPTDSTRALIHAPDKAWPRFMAECVDVLFSAFRRHHKDDRQALEDARIAMIALAKYWGGRQIYIPVGESLDRAIRDRQIYLEYCGRNKTELAMRYDVTERRIDQIAAEQRAIAVRRIQPDLFPSERS